MKKFFIVTMVIVLAILLFACGKQYRCRDCGKTTNEAYYDMDAKEEEVMCEDCARAYWMPFPYENYKVK